MSFDLNDAHGIIKDNKNLLPEILTIDKKSRPLALGILAQHRHMPR